MTVTRPDRRWINSDLPLRLRLAVPIAVIISTLITSACSQISAAVLAPEHIDAPSLAPVSPEDNEIDGDSTWREVFNQLAASEQSCIRTSLGEDFGSLLDQPIVELDIAEPPPWLESFFDCLPEETVRSAYLIIWVRYWLDSLGLVLREEEESCLRSSAVEESKQGLVTCVSNLFGAISEVARASDDHAGTPSDATTLTDGQETEGTLDSVSDVDLFKFRASRGEHYRLDVALDTLERALLVLVSLDGGVLTSFNVYEYVGEATEIWLAASSADYVVGVLGPYSHTGTYSLTVSAVVDDHPDDQFGAASVSIGATVEGSVDHYDDRDVFGFQVEEGLFYLLDVGLGTLGDSLLAVEDAEGQLQAQNDDRYRGEPASRIVWKASASGLFYAAVSGGRSNIGTYRLTFSQIEDDHVDRRPGSTMVTLGAVVDGELNYERDVDVFAFEAEAAVVYKIGVVSETLVRPVFGVVGASEDYLAGNIGHSDYWTPVIRWKAPTQGIYYVALAGESIGRYTLTITATDLNDNHADTTSDATLATISEVVQSAVEHVHDEDLFGFDATEGVIYEVSVIPEEMSALTLSVVNAEKRQLATTTNYANAGSMQMLWQAPESDRYYIALGGPGTGAYNLTVNESQLVDMHGDTVTDASTAHLGESMSGGIDHVHDRDVFVFAATRDVIYEVVVTLGTLERVVLYVEDVDDEEVARLDFDDDPRVERLIWKAAATGNTYVMIDSRYTGTYTLKVGRSPVVDDHSDTRTKATRTRAGRVAQGMVDYEGDVDVFVFTAKKGELYDLDVDLGTLEDALMTVEDAEGTVLEWNTGNLYGGVPRAFWRAPATGEYFVQVASYGFNSRPGTYSLNISQVVDDHSDDEALATKIIVSEGVQGSMDDPWDGDWFVFEGDADVAYRIETSLGTLPGASLFLKASYDDWIASSDDAQGQPPSIVFYAASSGEHYVRVASSHLPGMGTYTLTVKHAEVEDDHAGNLSGATELMLGKPVPGVTDYVQDLDVFVFEAVAGRQYEIIVSLGTLSDVVATLYRDDGAVVACDFAKDSQRWQASWTAPESGAYYFVLRGSFYRVGTYTLTVTAELQGDVVSVR